MNRWHCAATGRTAAIGPMHRRSSSATARLGIGLLALLVGCGAAPDASPSPRSSAAATADPSPSAEPAEPTVVPAPGTESAIYAPNPDAIVVAIDPGHGGCLDWGVPDPSQRGVELAEKTLTLEIAGRLRDRLAGEGVGVVMTREGDEALAGDHHPPLGCEGPAWRDVNGDGEAGFDPEGATRTRDELQARLDLANLAAADALVSIHINSPFDAGQSIEIAFTETFYTDETPWGVELTERLAAELQDGVVRALGRLARYERGDRGITAHNFYLVAPPLFETTPDRPDPRRQPTRGALMPAVLSEVGSITLRAEHDLLASAAGQEAVADGLVDGLAAFFASRERAARIGLADAPVGAAPSPVTGDGPPFWAPVAPEGSFAVTVTNTGTASIAAGARLVAGWEASDQPYLRRAPDDLEPIGPELPALAPGASATVSLELPPPPAGRGLAWISLESEGETLADDGSPALQLASRAP